MNKNTLTTSAYLVLSITDLKSLLAAARKDRKLRNKSKDSHCIILRNLEVVDVSNDGEPQVSSATVSRAAAAIVAEAEAYAATPCGKAEKKHAALYAYNTGNIRLMN